MRKLIVLTHITLDGVLQGMGGPDEDTSDGFMYGGWAPPYSDDATGKVMKEQMAKPFELLLGRKTFEIFASFWPQHSEGWPGINEATKYVASNTLTEHKWQNVVFITGEVHEEVRKLKVQDGLDLKVWGSGNLIQTLLKHDLVDEFWLKIFPITLGTGKRLFVEGTIPAAFKLKPNSLITPSGVIVANYARAGEVKTGSY